MERQIGQWAWWLGLVCTVIALAWRGLNALGIGLPGMVSAGTTIWYMSFYKAALLFLLVSIAAANCAWMKGGRSGG